MYMFYIKVKNSMKFLKFYQIQKKKNQEIKKNERKIIRKKM